VKRRYLPAVAVVTALVLAGCGGSAKNASTTGGTGTTSTANSKALFLAQLNSLCERANNAFSAAHDLKGQVAVVSHYVSLFGAVKAPPQLRTLYAEYLAVLEKELADLRKGDTKGLFNLAHNQAKPLVEKIGAKGCVTAS
jgi:hypothetical protein